MFELHMLESKLKEEEYMLIKAKCKLINTQGLWCTMRDHMISWYAHGGWRHVVIDVKVVWCNFKMINMKISYA